MVSIPTGIVTTFAVAAHEIPQEIGDFAVLIHAGYSKGRALWLNFLSALLAILGLIFIFVLNQTEQFVILYFLPIAAGGFIYIAGADLIPELRKNHREDFVKHIMVILLGVFAMLALMLLE